jgi:glycosyltransferase involved in cell wall biosynthesis
LKKALWFKDRRMHNDISTMPLVSVIIPTFNRAHMLGDAIGSVVQQTYPKIEIIVIDDGSTDNTAEFIDQLQDSRIQYIRQDNAGVAAARNRGISASQGEYVAFLDSDDMYKPDCIEKKIALANAYPECVLIGGGCTYFTDAGNNLPPTPARKTISYSDLCIFTAFPGGTCNIFAKRSAVIAAGPFNTSLSDSEDRDFLRRLATLGSIKSCDDYTVAIRVHSELRPNRNRAKMFADREWVSQQIVEPHLRKKSRAWNAMVVGYDCWRAGEKIPALRWWLRSFLISPGPIHEQLPRLKPILRDHLLRR